MVNHGECPMVHAMFMLNADDVGDTWAEVKGKCICSTNLSIPTPTPSLSLHYDNALNPGFLKPSKVLAYMRAPRSRCNKHNLHSQNKRSYLFLLTSVQLDAFTK